MDSADGRMGADEGMTVGARLARLWESLAALLQLRARQAQGDAAAALRAMVMGVIFGAVAVVLVLLALPLLVTTIILALATAMPAWMAVLIVLAVLLAAVVGLLLMARARLRWRGIALVRDLRADWEDLRRKVGEGR